MTYYRAERDNGGCEAGSYFRAPRENGDCEADSYNIVCIGAATEDIFFFSDDFMIEDQNLLLPWKEKFTVERLERRLGGGAFNASVAFSRLGLKAAFFGRVGDDPAGRSVGEFLEKEGVSTEFLVTDPKVKTSTSALLSRQGERTIMMYRGENDNLLETNPPWEKLLKTKWVFLTDLAGTNNDLIFEIARQTAKRDIKLSYVPGQRELALGKEELKPVLAAAKLLILNFYEAEMILGGNPPRKTRRVWGSQPDGLENRRVEEMLSEFKKLGVGISVITLGEKGSATCDDKRVYYQEATPEVEVVDATGAGDAFSATFTAGIILGKTIPESLLLAAKNASSAITGIGGTEGLRALDQLKQLEL